MDFKNRSGAILVVSPQKNIAENVRSALAVRFGRVLCAGTLTEAKNAACREPVWLVIAFLPLEKDRGAGEIRELLLRDDLCLILHVAPELYYETAYMVQNEAAFVLRDPLRMDMLLQAVQIMNVLSVRTEAARKEKFRMKKQLQDLLLINRAKCVLIADRGMTEDAAHHYLERKAMNGGMTRAEAARQIIAGS